MNKYSVSPKMPHSGAPAIFMNLMYAIKNWGPNNEFFNHQLS